MTINAHSHQGHSYEYDRTGRFDSNTEIRNRIEQNPNAVNFPDNPNMKWDKTSGNIYEKIQGRWLIIGNNKDVGDKPGSAAFDQKATWYSEDSKEFREHNAIKNVHSYRDGDENHNYQYDTNNPNFKPTDEVNAYVEAHSELLPDGRRWNRDSGEIYENHEGRWNIIGSQKDNTKGYKYGNDLDSFYDGATFLDKKEFFEKNGIKNDIQETHNGVDFGDGNTDGGFIDDYKPNSEVDEFVNENRNRFSEQSDGDYYDPVSHNWYTYDEDLGRWCIWATSETENSPKTEFSGNAYDEKNGIVD